MVGFGINMKDENQIVHSVIIPTRNEEDYIEECINSLLNYCNDPWVLETTEFIIVDGKSEDRTINIVKEKFNYLTLKIFDNPNLYQSFAMNIGIKNSNSSSNNGFGQIIIRADAHSIYPKDYIKKCQKQLKNGDGNIGNVGSIQKAVGTNILTKTVASVMNSGYAMGGVKYRTRDFKEDYIVADTAYLGCWKKADLVKLGGFNEKLQINEDYELNIRIRKFSNNSDSSQNKIIIVSKDLEVSYYVRNTFSGLIKQFFRYGLWKTKTLSIHPDSLRKRQLAPVLFVLFLFVLILASTILPSTYFRVLMSLAIIGGLFWARIIIFPIWSKSSNKIINLLLIPLVVLSIHISWGLGFIFGLFKWTIGGWR